MAARGDPTRDPRDHRHKAVVKLDPSKGAKTRISNILEQDIEEFGKVVSSVRKQSQSKEILLKAAKHTASHEASMDITLSKLRLIESLLNRALNQADNVGRSMEQTAEVLSQIHHLTD